jgi:hypothetical protein
VRRDGNVGPVSERGFHERVAQNNLRFRRANEAIDARAIEYELTESLLPFLCECANERCTELVRLSAAEYDRVRADQRRFLVTPGHESADAQAAVVVDRQERYVVLEKVGRAGELVEEDRVAEEG